MALSLKEQPTLGEIQEYVREIERERGFDTTTSNVQSCLQLGEEIGELFKAVRKAEKMRVDERSAIGTIDEELADILIYVMCIANRYGVDLATALREKEEVNKRREWK